MAKDLRIYRAEKAFGSGRLFATEEEAQGYADRVLRSRWWRNLSPLRHVTVAFVEPPRVLWSKAHKDTWARGHIELVPGNRDEFSLIHELCHYPTWDKEYRDHGKMFVALLIEGTRKWMGKRPAKRLVRCLCEYKVPGVKDA